MTLISGTRALLKWCVIKVEGEQGSGFKGDEVLENTGTVLNKYNLLVPENPLE